VGNPKLLRFTSIPREKATVQKRPKLRVSPFDLVGNRLDLGRRWEKWLERFERDLKYNGVDPGDKDNAETAQMALLIYAGSDIEDLHDTLPTPTRPTGITNTKWTIYAKSKFTFTFYFTPKKSNEDVRKVTNKCSKCGYEKTHKSREECASKSQSIKSVCVMR